MTETPAGWFPDAKQPGRLRWWDGTAWTDNYHDENQAKQPQASQAQATQAQATQPRAWGPPASAGADRARRRPGPSLILSIVMIVLGLGIVVACGALAVVPFVRNIASDDVMRVPGEATFKLESGKYLVYERTGTSGDSDQGVTINAEAVRITGPDGTLLEVSNDTGATETITKGSQDYTGTVEFEVTDTGDYTVEVADGQPGRALVARSLSDTIKRALPWFLIGALGGLVLLAGIIMAIVGAIRRHRWTADQKAMPATHPE